jgi:hypothetical protein
LIGPTGRYGVVPVTTEKIMESDGDSG